jgi:hypothetical protein
MNRELENYIRRMLARSGSSSGSGRSSSSPRNIYYNSLVREREIMVKIRQYQLELKRVRIERQRALRAMRAARSRRGGGRSASYEAMMRKYAHLMRA